MTDKLEPITDATLANLEALRRSKTASKIAVAFTVRMHVTSMITRIRTDAAEIKRLREALERIAENDFVRIDNPSGKNLDAAAAKIIYGAWQAVLNIARAALKGGE